MGGPGFDPHLVELSGLRVRPFEVSGGSPRPPPEQAPVVNVKTPRVSKIKVIEEAADTGGVKKKIGAIAGAAWPLAVLKPIAMLCI